MKRREVFRKNSNNAANTNKNVCALEAAKYLMVDHTVHYLHTWQDVVRAARNRWTVRSRFSSLGTKPLTVGAARKRIAAIAEKERGVLCFMVGVKGHILLLDKWGNTIIDTAPSKRDKRKVTELAIVLIPELQ